MTWSHAARGLLLALAATLAACHTDRPVQTKPRPPVEAAFTPQTYVSRIHLAEGGYPDLFAPSSYALWVSPEVTELKRAQAIGAGEQIPPDLEAAAALIEARYLVFECRAESAFADMSIAYDLVGFRGVDVYLETPDGRRIAPVRTVIGTRADDTPLEALRRFGRTNLVVFLKHDVATGRPIVDPDARFVRLILEGHGSRFYFEWQGPRRGDWAPGPEETLHALKTGFSDLYGRLLRVSHTFD